MPEPLATPRMDTSFLPTLNFAEAIFLRVSVVRMASENSRNFCSVACRDANNAGRFATLFSLGSGTPIIPVDDGTTCRTATPRIFAVSWQTWQHAFIPASPVAQFAFPAFTRTARTRPRDAASVLRPTSTGAATRRFLVKSAAAQVPSAASMRARSGRPLAFMPDARAEKENPFGKWIVFCAETSSVILAVSPASFGAPEGWRISATRLSPWRLHRSRCSADKRSSPYESCRAILRVAPDRIQDAQKIPVCV